MWSIVNFMDCGVCVVRRIFGALDGIVTGQYMWVANGRLAVVCDKSCVVVCSSCPGLFLRLVEQEGRGHQGASDFGSPVRLVVGKRFGCTVVPGSYKIRLATGLGANSNACIC